MKLNRLEVIVLEEIAKNGVLKSTQFLDNKYGFIQEQLNVIIQQLLIKKMIHMDNEYLYIHDDLKDKAKEVKNKENNINEKFNKFWELYPLKKGKQQALKVFIKLNPNDELFEKIMKGLIIQMKIKKEKERKKEWTEAWKFPQGWINGKRWEDEDKDIEEVIYQQPKFYKSDR